MKVESDMFIHLSIGSLFALLTIGGAWAEPLSDTPSLTSQPRTKSCRELFNRSTTEEFSKQCIALAGPLAAMQGESLIIRMDDGRRKTFRNEPSEIADAAYGYGLDDFFPTTHIFVVVDFSIDSQTTNVIDGRTGRKMYRGPASAAVSPDGHWVFLSKDNGDFEHIMNDFEVADISGEKPRTVWTAKKSKTAFAPQTQFIAWEDDTTVKLGRLGNLSVFISRAQDGSWHLK